MRHGILTLGLLVVATPAAAGWLTFQPTPIDLYDLDHHDAYTWRIDNIPSQIPAGHVITGARIFIDNIRNWQVETNQLFIHMFDTADPGVRSEVDSDDTQIIDAFQHPGAGNYIDAVVRLLVDTYAQGTGTNGNVDSADRAAAKAIGNTNLVSPSFTTTAIDYTYNFTASQVTSLIQYLANGGDVALALDPDCHFFNDGLYFKIFTEPSQIQVTGVPEPASLVLLGLGLSGLAAGRRRRNRTA